MSTVEDMADLPFGFSGDDPERDKRKKDPDSGSGPGDSGSDPFGSGFDMSELGQIFSKLGEMFSGAGGAMTGGTQSGPVNYDLARQLASSSIGFVAPIPEKTGAAISDAVHLAETWLDGVTALPAGTTRAVAWTPTDWIDNTLDRWKRLVRSGGRTDFDGVGLGVARGSQEHGRAAAVDDVADGRHGIRLAARPGTGQAVARSVDLHRHWASAGPEGRRRADA